MRSYLFSIYKLFMASHLTPTEILSLYFDLWSLTQSGSLLSLWPYLLLLTYTLFPPAITALGLWGACKNLAAFFNFSPQGIFLSILQSCLLQSLPATCHLTGVEESVMNYSMALPVIKDRQLYRRRHAEQFIHIPYTSFITNILKHQDIPESFPILSTSSNQPGLPHNSIVDLVPYWSLRNPSDLPHTSLYLLKEKVSPLRC